MLQEVFWAGGHYGKTHFNITPVVRNVGGLKYIFPNCERDGKVRKQIRTHLATPAIQRRNFIRETNGETMMVIATRRTGLSNILESGKLLWILDLRFQI